MGEEAGLVSQFWGWEMSLSKSPSRGLRIQDGREGTLKYLPFS